MVLFYFVFILFHYLFLYYFYVILFYVILLFEVKSLNVRFYPAGLIWTGCVRSHIYGDSVLDLHVQRYNYRFSSSAILVILNYFHYSKYHQVFIWERNARNNAWDPKGWQLQKYFPAKIKLEEASEYTHFTLSTPSVSRGFRL